MMFDKSWTGYPCPSLFECLIVFAVLFLSGSLWSSCIKWYVKCRMEEAGHV